MTKFLCFSALIACIVFPSIHAEYRMVVGLENTSGGLFQKIRLCLKTPALFPLNQKVMIILFLVAMRLLLGQLSLRKILSPCI